MVAFLPILMPAQRNTARVFTEAFLALASRPVERGKGRGPQWSLLNFGPVPYRFQNLSPPRADKSDSSNSGQPMSDRLLYSLGGLSMALAITVVALMVLSI